LSLVDFRKKPVFGCPQCYDAFAKELEPIFWHTHGTPNSPEQLQHIGKKPKKYQPPPPPQLTKQQQVIKLKYKMAQAIKKENYEEAATLRDAINELEEKELDE
jgi:protein arginine kinase activator